MAIVREHIAVVERQMATNPAFSDVRLFVATGYGGALGVTATVASDDELERIQQAVDATSPPFGVLYLATYPDGVHAVWCPPN